MKTRLIEILTFSFLLLFCFSCIGQKQNPPAKVDKNHTKSSSSKVEDMVGIIEVMPRFPVCEDQGLVKGELEECAKNALINYIYKNLEYPKQAIEKGIEGRSIIQFYIDIDGAVKDVKLVRGFDERCDNAALDVVKKMQSEFIWVPGTQRGRIVKVLYTLPIKFGSKNEKVVPKKNQTLIDRSSSSDPIKELPPVTDPPPPPPPPPPPSPVVDEVDVPVFKGCENLNLNNKDLEKCSKEGMLNYIYDNLVYPEKAKENCTEGMVVVQFVLDKCGDLQNIRLVRDIGDGCGEAVMKVFNEIRDKNLWIPAAESPGKARGRPINIQYTIPVKFKWDND